jgi:hypothetical protein
MEKMTRHNASNGRMMLKQNRKQKWKTPSKKSRKEEQERRAGKKRRKEEKKRTETRKNKGRVKGYSVIMLVVVIVVGLGIRIWPACVKFVGSLLSEGKALNQCACRSAPLLILCPRNLFCKLRVLLLQG